MFIRIITILFRSDKFQHVLRMALNKSIKNDFPELAKLIYEKFGDEKKLISEDPFFQSSTERYFNICRQLEKNAYLRNNNEKRQRERQQRNKEVYQNFLCHLLQSDSIKDQGITLNNLEEDFECPVCFELMVAPRQIFSCGNGHFLCSDCLRNPKIKSCPICRDNFNTRKPKRSIKAEKRAEELKSNEVSA